MMMPNSPMAGAPPAPTAPPAPGPVGAGAYPAGAEVMAQQEAEQAAAQGQVDNPVIAGFQAIMMLVGQLKQAGDPRADAAVEALRNLLTALSGGEGLPGMESPIPEQPGAPGPAPGMVPPAPGGAMAPGQTPAMPGAPAAPGPGPVEPVGNPFEAPPAAPAAPVRPMGPMVQNKGKKQPVVLAQ